MTPYTLIFQNLTYAFTIVVKFDFYVATPQIHILSHHILLQKTAINQKDEASTHDHWLIQTK